MPNVTENIIAGELSAEGSHAYQAIDAANGNHFGPRFMDASGSEVDRACRAASDAFSAYAAMALAQRAAFLDTIAERLDAAADELVATIPAETGLPEARVRGELARTTGQMRLFATVVRRGDFLQARIDPAEPERKPAARADVRTCRVALGPVVVFGASNFPLAFSVAGVDTASALAAGCPVVVKAHPGHPGASAIIAGAISEAVKHCDMPAGVFSLLHGADNAVGSLLVKHPAIKAVGFTGSLRGGSALAKLAAERAEPIPVYAEMGSVNPMFLLPQVLRDNGDSVAQGYIGSVNMGCGQFCTSPGLVFAPQGEALERFVSEAGRHVEQSSPGVMLHPGILAAYNDSLSQRRGIEDLTLVAEGQAGDNRAQTRLYRTTIGTWRENPLLAEEVFGPASLVVEVAGADELPAVAKSLAGQLTAAVHGTRDELPRHAELVTALQHRAGRVLFNGFPTGVEVCDAMVHGGPWPATTDGKTTSVGSLAIDRYLRPVCYQDCPAALLPPALQDGNPLDLHRWVNGQWSNGAI